MFMVSLGSPEVSGPMKGPEEQETALPLDATTNLEEFRESLAHLEDFPNPRVRVIGDRPTQGMVELLREVQTQRIKIMTDTNMMGHMLWKHDKIKAENYNPSPAQDNNP